MKNPIKLFSQPQAAPGRRRPAFAGALAIATPPVRSDGKASDDTQMRLYANAIRGGSEATEIRVDSRRFALFLSYPARSSLNPQTIFKKIPEKKPD